MTWPGGGSLTYTYDQLNRMDTVTDVASAVQLVDYTWDTLSRRDLSAFNVSGFTADYAYENDDDLNSLIHSGPKPLTFTIGRNLASQINSLSASDGAFLSTPSATQTDTLAPNKLNQVQTFNGTTYSYDANGNLTTDGTFTYEYDEENRLRSAVGAGNTVSYEYDPLGRRRAKIVNGVTTKYASDGAEEIEERDGSNNVLRRYAYGPSIDDRIAMFDASACAHSPSNQSWCFYLTNWQGSSTTLVRRSGATPDVYHYGPYGEGTNWTPSDALTGNPFRYTGRRVDPETGLYYYRARYYSPKLGRFLQVDPIGTKDDFNLYAYARNDPMNGKDPTGTSCVGEDKEAKCTIDRIGGKDFDRSKLSTAMRTKVERLEKNLTEAYKKALAKGDKEVTVKGSKKLGIADQKVKASRIAMEMQDRKFNAADIKIRDPAGGLIVAEAAERSLNFYAPSLNRTPGRQGDHLQQVDFGHEILHYLPQLGAWRHDRYEHQVPFDDAAEDLLR